MVEQAHGPTTDGRSKPELLGNAAVDSVSTSANWRNGFLAGSGYNGTSFAAPFVTGAVAQMLDYGKRVGENTDHRVIKAIVTNSGVKSFDANGDPWSNEATRPLDDQLCIASGPYGGKHVCSGSTQFDRRTVSHWLRSRRRG